MFLFWLFLLVNGKHVHRVQDPNCPTFAPTCLMRTFYIAAQEVDWDYAPSGMDHIAGQALTETDAFVWTVRYPNRIGSIYQKSIFEGYTDHTFTELLPKDPHLGILGPVIRAEVGDLIRIVFLNNASRPFGVHAHGVRYSKQDEGAHYHNIHHAMHGAAVEPGQVFEYTWIVQESAGPGPKDDDCVLWAYHSHLMHPQDIYSGLMGPMVIYRPGILDPVSHLPKNIDREFFLHFMVYDENLSPYLRTNIERFASELNDRLPKDKNADFILGGDTWVESNKMHAINGRMYGNLPGLEMAVGENVRWHLMGFGTEIDIHTVHWHGSTMLWQGHRVDVIELLPASFRTVKHVPDAPGLWMLHCHVEDHMVAGMNALYHIAESPIYTYSQSPVSNLTIVQASKEDMSVSPAKRPPLAEIVRPLSSATSLQVSLIPILLSFLTFYL